MCIAHKAGDGRTESLHEHAWATARLAEAFAAEFGAGEMGRAAGFLHDIGKSSEGFQRRILHGGPKVEHSAAGAKLCMDTPGGLALMLAYCIAGHHAGLPDGGTDADTVDDATLVAKKKRQDRQALDCTEALEGHTVPSLLPKTPPSVAPLGKGAFSASFFIRMLYSCLVDADFLCTEAFMNGQPLRAGVGEDIPALLTRLEAHMRAFAAPRRPLDEKRCQVLADCRAAALWAKGLYTLTVPTGGGKTLSSLSFALGHAREHGMRRVVYAIPYTSIINQTAGVFREVVGEGNVLEHHSNVQYDDDRSEAMNAARLASENWDAPLVVTTNVQLFESLFANRSSRCRKLHNLANSVLILDEAQMLPQPQLIPCLWAIAELVRNYGCTVVLMSATQPALQGLFPAGMRAREICGDAVGLYAFFRRAKLLPPRAWTQAELVDRLAAQRQALCVVNTRAQARALFERLPPEGSFHLSTLMTPRHRRAMLEEIRDRLKNGLPCRVVSTSLIEAGVDVDFPTVFRQEAGLDSQIQAAGRCNREGRRPLEESLVYIFSLSDGAVQPPPSMRRPVEVAREVGKEFEDCAAPEAIAEYFKRMYHFAGEEALDIKRVVHRLEEAALNGFMIPFASVAGDFALIDSATRSVLAPEDEKARAIAGQLRAGHRGRELLRAAGQYMVNVYDRDFWALDGHVEALDEQLAILTDMELYSPRTGLRVPDTGVGIIL